MYQVGSVGKRSVNSQLPRMISLAALVFTEKPSSWRPTPPILPVTRGSKISQNSTISTASGLHQQTVITMAETQKKLQALTEEYQKLQTGRRASKSHKQPSAPPANTQPTQTSKASSTLVKSSNHNNKKTKAYRANSPLWTMKPISTSSWDRCC